MVVLKVLLELDGPGEWKVNDIARGDRADFALNRYFARKRDTPEEG